MVRTEAEQVRDHHRPWSSATYLNLRAWVKGRRSGGFTFHSAHSAPQQQLATKKPKPLTVNQLGLQQRASVARQMHTVSKSPHECLLLRHCITWKLPPSIKLKTSRLSMNRSVVVRPKTLNDHLTFRQPGSKTNSVWHVSILSIGGRKAAGFVIAR